MQDTQVYTVGSISKRIIPRKRRTFAVTVQTIWFFAILKHPYEVLRMLRETSESVIVIKMHLTGSKALSTWAREYWWTGGSSSQRLQADWWITISESTGGLADRHLREYGRTGRSPTERFRGDGWIAISEITG